MQIIQRIDNLGQRESASLANDTETKVFASVTPTQGRQGVNIQNHDASQDLYVYLTSRGASAPTISTTAHDMIIEAGKNREILVGVGVAIWLWQDSGGGTDYTAVELL